MRHIWVNQKAVTLRLERLGYDPDVVANGQTDQESPENVIMAWQREGYDVILVGVQMPALDGLEATCRIRQVERFGRHVHVIAVTAHALEEGRKLVSRAGWMIIWVKPFAPNHLYLHSNAI